MEAIGFHAHSQYLLVVAWMDLGDPATVVVSSGMSAVLRALVNADYAFTIRQLSRVSGLTAPSTQKIVHRLAEHGLVLTRSAGRATLCSYNNQHLAADAVRELVTLRSRLLELLRRQIAGWAVPPLHASLFGSGARGDGDTRSDLDVLVVRSGELDTPRRQQWDDQLSITGEIVRSSTGNSVGWFDQVPDELSSAMRRGEVIVDEWRRDALLLAGEPLESLLRTLS